MEANELMQMNFMIGDFMLFYDEDECQNDLVKIVGIDYDGWMFYEFLDGTRQEGWSKNLFPIPITPEILEKNGWKHEFDKKDYMVKYDLSVEGKNCWMMWAVKEHNLDIQRQDEKLDVYNLKIQRVCLPCDFVHELQHALRLCGIEKEIVL